MDKTYNIFYKDVKIENAYSNSLASSIVRLGLKEGDKIRSYPFNSEKTNYKEEPLEYQCIPLKILEINYEFLNSWNNTIKITVNIYIGKY